MRDELPRDDEANADDGNKSNLRVFDSDAKKSTPSDNLEKLKMHFCALFLAAFMKVSAFNFCPNQRY